MQDNYHREINYLRVSVTDRCNLRCFYCLPLHGVQSIPHEEVLRLDSLRPEKYARITRGGDLAKVWAGIETALALEMRPVKLNTVLLKGLNDETTVLRAQSPAAERYGIRAGRVRRETGAPPSAERRALTRFAHGLGFAFSQTAARPTSFPGGPSG